MEKDKYIYKESDNMNQTLKTTNGILYVITIVILLLIIGMQKCSNFNLRNTYDNQVLVIDSLNSIINNTNIIPLENDTKGNKVYKEWEDPLKIINK